VSKNQEFGIFTIVSRDGYGRNEKAGMKILPKGGSEDVQTHDLG
jgi:hypothetical protein